MAKVKKNSSKSKQFGGKNLKRSDKFKNNRNEKQPRKQSTDQSGKVKKNRFKKKTVRNKGNEVSSDSDIEVIPGSTTISQVT